MSDAGIQVGIYLDTSDTDDVNLSSPEEGNPGIGASEFLMASLPHYMEKVFPRLIELTVYYRGSDLLPPGVSTIEVSDGREAMTQATGGDTDVFIWRPTKSMPAIPNDCGPGDLTAIGWAHNTNIEILRSLVQDDRLYSIVCVSKQQMKNLRTYEPFDDSTYIFNGFHADPYIPDAVSSSDLTVTFLGGLYMEKGFHRLAGVWPEVIDKFPDARLEVIGSGKLYDRNQKLGKWGVATETYEQKFRAPLAGDNGSPLDSVTFHGLVSQAKKIDILQDTTVGVINPRGTETFSVSAVEFQAAGTPVVSRAKGGVLDTVKHQETGLLHTSDRAMVGNIKRFLSKPELAQRYGQNGIYFVSHMFNYPRICSDWLELLTRAKHNCPLPMRAMDRTYNTQFSGPSSQVRDLIHDIGRKTRLIKLRDVAKKSDRARKIYRQLG
jgi:glycosyltransferase involved in cell wall biosynthesis